MFYTSVFNDYECYKEEIELSCAQNHGVEIELYSIIASIIREYSPDISLRDVSSRRTIKDDDIDLKGVGGFPDFVVLERALSYPQIFGCIEAKNTYEMLDKHVRQVADHIKSFKRVLFTNGLEWRFFNGSSKEIWYCKLGHREIIVDGRKKKTLLFGMTHLIGKTL